MENKDHYMWDGLWLWQCSCSIHDWKEFLTKRRIEIVIETDFDLRCFFRWIWCLNKVKIFVTRSNDNSMPWNADDQNNYQSQLTLSKMHFNTSKVKWLAHLFFLYTLSIQCSGFDDTITRVAITDTRRIETWNRKAKK